METIAEETLTPPQEVLTPPSISDEELNEYVRVRTIHRRKIVEVKEKYLVLRDTSSSDGLLYHREEEDVRLEDIHTEGKFSNFR